MNEVITYNKSYHI